MKLHTFLMISTIARIPSVITSTIGGHALGTPAVCVRGGGVRHYHYRQPDRHPGLSADFQAGKGKEKEESQNDTISGITAWCFGLLSRFIAQLIKFIIEVSTHRRIN